MAGIISGKKGESLFHEPLLRFFQENPIPELLSKTADLHDDRLLAVVTALVVEDRLDKALKSFLPKYDGKDFSFAKKILLMEALSFVPPRILDAARLFGNIRNTFAHNLQIDSFSRLAPKFSKHVRDLRTAIIGSMSSRQSETTFIEDFRFAAFFCVVGFQSYSENLSFLRAHIESDEFLNSLVKKCEDENKARMEAVFARGPISVETVDGHLVERYVGDVFKITGDGANGPIDLGKIIR